jgi:hypothetical protein
MAGFGCPPRFQAQAASLQLLAQPSTSTTGDGAWPQSDQRPPDTAARPRHQSREAKLVDQCFGWPRPMAQSTFRFGCPVQFTAARGESSIVSEADGAAQSREFSGLLA